MIVVPSTLLFPKKNFANGPQIRLYSIEEEQPAKSSGYFSLPNEYETYKFRQILQQYSQGKVLISLGTFRSLFDFTIGNFSRLIILDHDSIIHEFNSANLKLIAVLSKTGLSSFEQRKIYLEILTESSFLEKIENDSELRLALSKFDNCNSNRNLEIYQKLGEEILAYRSLAIRISDLPILKKGLTGTSSIEFINRMRNVIKIFASHEDNYLSTYWANNAGWEKIQASILFGRVHIVHGSIIGNTTMASIGEALKKNNEQVSVVDISNIFDYLLGREKLDQLANNLTSLPLADTAHVLYTRSISNPVKYEIEFKYKGFSFNDFINKVRNKEY